jgi:hypothetical protein
MSPNAVRFLSDLVYARVLKGGLLQHHEASLQRNFGLVGQCCADWSRFS